MTNLDSILESRDITLPTKVHLVKALVFPVVVYGCESWTKKNYPAIKSKDITLSTKVRLVQAMVFPAVMCGCES